MAKQGDGRKPTIANVVYVNEQESPLLAAWIKANPHVWQRAMRAHMEAALRDGQLPAIVPARRRPKRAPAPAAVEAPGTGQTQPADAAGSFAPEPGPQALAEPAPSAVRLEMPEREAPRHAVPATGGEPHDQAGREVARGLTAEPADANAAAAGAAFPKAPAAPAAGPVPAPIPQQPVATGDSGEGETGPAVPTLAAQPPSGRPDTPQADPVVPVATEAPQASSGAPASGPDASSDPDDARRKAELREIARKALLRNTAI